MDSVKEFAEKLIMGLVKNPDIVKIQDFSDEDGSAIIEIIIHSDDMGTVIGKSGKNVKAIRTLISAAAYKQGIHRVKVNIDSI